MKNRMLLFIGLGLTLLAVLGVFFLGRLLNPAPLSVPVAVSAIHAGTPLEQSQFRLEAWVGVRPQTARAFYAVADFPLGATPVVDIPAGSPLYRAYVADPENVNFLTRLTHLLPAGSDLTLMAIPVSPELGGNIPRPGDEVDLLIGLGALAARELQSHPAPLPADAPPIGVPTRPQEPTRAPTQTESLPAAVLVMQNVPVVQLQQQFLTTGYGGEGGNQPQTVAGNTELLYVTVTRPQAEVLSWLLHTGRVRVAVHPPGLTTAYPGGVTWRDFEVWFFENRDAPSYNAEP